MTRMYWRGKRISNWGKLATKHSVNNYILILFIYLCKNNYYREAQRPITKLGRNRVEWCRSVGHFTKYNQRFHCGRLFTSFWIGKRNKFIKFWVSVFIRLARANPQKLWWTRWIHFKNSFPMAIWLAISPTAKIPNN